VVAVLYLAAVTTYDNDQSVVYIYRTVTITGHQFQYWEYKFCLVTSQCLVVVTHRTTINLSVSATPIVVRF
jgi:hypothetical protein